MQVVKRLGHWVAICLLGASPLFGPAGPAHAYVPPLDDLLEQLAGGAPSAGSAIIDLQCRVYPVAPAGEATPAAQPAPDRGRGFRQRVYWQRGSLLAVETLADDGTVLHVLLKEAGFTQAAQLSTTRRFSTADIRPLLYPFLEGKVAAWSRELTYWGVQPTAVDLALTKTGQMYRMTDDPDKALWLDKETLRPVRLTTRVDGGPGPWLLSIEFSDFISFAARGPEKDPLRIPRRITYAVNGATFKDVQMT